MGRRTIGPRLTPVAAVHSVSVLHRLSDRLFWRCDSLNMVCVYRSVSDQLISSAVWSGMARSDKEIRLIRTIYIPF